MALPGRHRFVRLHPCPLQHDDREIYDADVEINSADFDINVTGDASGADLESILTHEFGHFLGMAHAGATDPDATMRAGWNGTGTDLRTLTHDDEEGICKIYPPGRSAGTSCEPRHGFASACFVPLTEPSSVSCASMARGNGTASGGGERRRPARARVLAATCGRSTCRCSTFP